LAAILQLRFMGLSARGFGARFWSLFGATFLGFLGIGTVLPGLAPHIRHDLGGSDQTVGFVIGIFSVVALVARFVSGPLADRRGRKLVFLTGLASCGLAGGSYLLPLGIGGAYLGRILQGFGEACLYTGAATWMVEVAGIEHSAQALGFLSSAIWGGLCAGPVVGSWLGSFERAAALQMIGAVASFAAVLLIPEDFRPEKHPRERQWLPRSLMLPGVVIGLVNVHYPVVTGFLILYLARYGHAGPAAFSAYAGLMLGSRFFLGGLPDRFHPAITYYCGLAAMAIGLSGIALGPSGMSAVGMTALLGFGFSFPWSAVASEVMKRTPSDARGSAISILSAFCDLFVGISSFAAGTMAGRFGYASAFWMAAVAVGAAAVAGYFVFAGRVAPRLGPMKLVGEVELVGRH
jgi:MFS family permease